MQNISKNEKVLIEVRKGMISLLQACRISHDELKESLKPCRYILIQKTPGLWHNPKTDVYFTLIINDFRLKYTSIKKLRHLIDALKTRFKIVEDWIGNLCCRVNLE